MISGHHGAVHCRGENPNVVATCKDLKDKASKSLVFRLTKQKRLGLKELRKMALPTLRFLTYSIGSQQQPKAYAVNGIPHCYYRKRRKIAAKNLRGAELRAKVEELLK